MTDTAAGEPLRWDPFDASYKANPHAVWRRLRDEAPLYRNEQYDFWALSRFGDVMATSLDPVTFSSAYGTVLEFMNGQPMATNQMIFMDQPEHTVYRRLVSAFTVRRVADLEPQIRRLCAELLEPSRGTVASTSWPTSGPWCPPT